MHLHQLLKIQTNTMHQILYIYIGALYEYFMAIIGRYIVKKFNYDVINANSNIFVTHIYSML